MLEAHLPRTVRRPLGEVIAQRDGMTQRSARSLRWRPAQRLEHRDGLSRLSLEPGFVSTKMFKDAIAEIGQPQVNLFAQDARLCYHIRYR